MLRAVAAKASVVQALVSEKSAFVASLGSQLALATSELNAAQDTLASLNAPGDSEAKSQAVVEYHAQAEEVAYIYIY